MKLYEAAKQLYIYSPKAQCEKAIEKTLSQVLTLPVGNSGESFIQMKAYWAISEVARDNPGEIDDYQVEVLHRNDGSLTIQADITINKVLETLYFNFQR